MNNRLAGRHAAAVAATCLAAAVARAADPGDTVAGAPTTAPVTTKPAEGARNPISGSTTETRAGSTVENPLATRWARFKPGSTAAYAMDMTAPGGQNVKGTATLTLNSVESTGVSVDSAVVIGGQAMQATPATFPAEVDADAVKRTGTADVVAMGKTFKCDVYDCTQAAFGQRAGTGGTMTVYLSPDVPGGMVKAVAQQAGQPTGTLTLTAMSAK